MTTVKETLEKCASAENIAGSRRSLNFYKSVYKADDLENYESLVSLEDAWNGYANSLHPMLDLKSTRDGNDDDAINSFISSVEGGVIPSPEVLLAICDALRRYLAFNGDLSLDQSFFGKPHAKNTSYAMAKGSNNVKMRAFSLDVSLQQGRQKNKSQVAVAEEFLSNIGGNDIDAETFLRSWRRWRNASRDWSD